MCKHSVLFVLIHKQQMYREPLVRGVLGFLCLNQRTKATTTTKSKSGYGATRLSRFNIQVGKREVFLFCFQIKLCLRY